MILGSPAARAWIAVFAWGTAAWGLPGCGDNQPPIPNPIPGEVQVVLGGAAADGSGFGALEGDVPLIPGAQGGFHVWVKYRVIGWRVGMVRVAYTARRVSDDRLILKSGRAQDVGAANAAGYWESPAAIPAFMCPSPLGIQVRDEQIRFQLEIVDPDGVSLGGAEAQATPHCPEGDQSAFCIRICSG